MREGQPREEGQSVFIPPSIDALEGVFEEQVFDDGMDPIPLHVSVETDDDFFAATKGFKPENISPEAWSEYVKKRSAQ